MDQKNGESTPYNVLGVQQTTLVFLIWQVQQHLSAIVHLSHPSLKEITFQEKFSTYLRS